MERKKFTKLFRDHADAMYRFAYWRVSDEAQAEDIVSTVFAKAWEKRDSFDGRNAQAWLYKIARNTIIDGYRKVRPIELNEDILPAKEDDTAAKIDSQIAAKKLLRAMSMLDEQSREIIHWRFIERASGKEIAERLGISQANVRVMQFRALHKLRKFYER